MRSKKLTIVLSVVAIVAISANATPNQIITTPNGGGYVPTPTQPTQQPNRAQIMQKAVSDLDNAQRDIASMVNDNKKLLNNQKAFGIKMTQLKSYISADLNNSSSCRVTEEQFKLQTKGSTISDANQKIVDECYAYAKSSLDMHSYIIGMMRGLLREMVNIKNTVESNSIKAKMLEKRIISLTAAIQVLGD